MRLINLTKSVVTINHRVAPLILKPEGFLEFKTEADMAPYVAHIKALSGHVKLDNLSFDHKYEVPKVVGKPKPAAKPEELAKDETKA